VEATNGGVRVVLVEDNQVFRETLELLLAMRSGIEIVGSVASGAEAVEACAELRPDVVLIDYRMPGMNGAQATSALLRASPATRVVCLTASISTEETELVLAAGAVACLTKDESLDRIVEAVHAAANGAGPA
jgi:DNA-binding NarL/FixJ family response regulator